MKRRHFISVFLLLMAVAACGPNLASKQPRKITLGGPPNISLLAEIAEANGYFTSQGLNVEYQPVQTGKLAQDAVVAGRLDYGLVLDVNVAYLGFMDTKVRALALVASKSDDGLISRRDHGVTSARDLAGKRIAYLPGTTSHVFIDRLLARAGVDRAGVTFLSMAPPAMQAAIVRGDIDAASVWQPFRQNAASALGDRSFEITDPKLYTAQVLLVRNGPAPASADSEEVRVLRALAEAAAFARANPSRAQAIVAPSLGLPRSTVASLWGAYGFNVQPADAARGDIQELGRWISSSQAAYSGRTTPDYTSLIGDPHYVALALH